MTEAPQNETEGKTQGLSIPSPPAGAVSSLTPVTGYHRGRAFPGFGQAILLFICLIFLQVLLTLPFVVFGLYRNPLALAFPILVGSAVALFYGYSLNFRRTGERFAEVFSLTPVSTPLFFFILVAVIGLLTLNLQLTRIVLRLIPPPSAFSHFLADTIRPGQPWTAFVALALVAPISEEFLFRGLVLHAFIARYGTRKATVASALLFALMHGNLWQFCPGLLFGIFLAWCFIRTRSLLPCFFAHCANNSIVYFLPRIQPRLPALGTWMQNHYMLVDAVGILFLITGGCLIYKFSNVRHLRLSPENQEEIKC
jgi:membrane protease YdiL (CAAX protease family)